MSGTLESLQARLDLETATFRTHIREARKKVSELEGELGKLGKRANAERRALDEMGSALSSFAKGAMAVVSVGAAAAAIKSMVGHTLEAADALGKMSQKVGVSVEDLSRLQQAAELSDVSSEQLQTALVHLSKSAVEASKGTGAQADAFRDLGISVVDANGKMRPTKALLDDVADAFAGMDGGAEKTRLALDVFGKSGAEILPLLNGLREASTEADRLGTVFSEKLAKDSEEVNDNLARLEGTFKGIAREITEALMPALKGAARELIGVAKSYRELVAGSGRSGTFSEDGEDRLSRGRLRSQEDEDADAFEAESAKIAAEVERAQMRERVAYESAELERARALAARGGASAFGRNDIGARARASALAELDAGVLEREGGGDPGLPDSWMEMKRLEADRLKADQRIWEAEKRLEDERTQALREAMDEREALLNQFATPVERLREKLAALNEAFDREPSPALTRAIGEVKDQLRGVPELAQQAEEGLQRRAEVEARAADERRQALAAEVASDRAAVAEAGDRIASVLAQHMVQGFRGGLRQMLADFNATLLQMAAQRAAQGIVNSAIGGIAAAFSGGGASSAPHLAPGAAGQAGILSADAAFAPSALTAGPRGAGGRVDVHHHFDSLARRLTQQDALERVLADEAASR